MTTQQEREEAWREDQLDPDNWVRIPEFGIAPAAVAFEGFAFPIVCPSGRFYEARVEVRASVKMARDIARKHFATMGELLETEMAGLDAQMAGEPTTERMWIAMLYRFFMHSVEWGLLSAIGLEGAARSLAAAGPLLAELVAFDCAMEDAAAADQANALLARVRQRKA